MLFPDDEIEGGDIAALPADRLKKAAESAVRDGRIGDIQKAREESGAFQANGDPRENVDDLYLSKLLDVCAEVDGSVKSNS